MSVLGVVPIYMVNNIYYVGDCNFFVILTIGIFIEEKT